MKKFISGITACIVISLVFISCPNDPGVDSPVIPNNPTQKGVIVFDNTYGICAAVVYDDYRRRDMDRIAEIPAGQCSSEFERAASTSTPFYFAYRISLKGINDFTVDFVPEVGKDQKAVRIDANTKIVVPIPVLDEAVSNQQQLLSRKSYLTVLNSSASSFELHRGVSMIRPDNSSDSGVVNIGVRAPYTVNPGRSSDYRLLVESDYKSFPDSPDRFIAGNFYSYIFNTDVSLDTQMPINLDNIDIKTYTVNFDSNGGSGTIPTVQNIRAASGITLPVGNELSKGDEIFGGWSVDASGAGVVYSAGTRYTVTSDITLYAKWYPAGTTLYTVVFDSAGGSETASQSMVAGAVAIRPPDPYKAGNTFGGWYSEPGAQSPYNFAAPVSEDFTLYAKWIANRYTVTFNANGASGAAPASVTVDYGVGITLPGAGGLTKEGETFWGWNTEYDGTGNVYASGAQYTVTADVTLFAVWNPVEPPPGEIDGFIKMVWVPGGSFEMGKNLGTGGGSDVTPVHTVTFSGFYMGIYEVTQAQYEAVMWTTIEEQQALAGTDTTNYGRGDTYPMYYVSWYDALVFCNKLSMAEGLSSAYRILGSTNPSDWGSVPTSSNSAWDAVEIIGGSTGYRLPTEAQWEYAAKGGNGSPGNYTYAGGNSPDAAAWYSGNSGSATHTVGTKTPNSLGLYDMSGNVSEWCWDWNGSYSSEAQTNPTGASSGSDRIIRGGSWYHSAQYAYSVFRFNNNQYSRNNSQGFRLVRPVAYTITFNINGGTGTNPAAQTVGSDSTITLPGGDRFSKNGYAFGGWNTNANGTGETYSAGSSYMVTGNITLYAKWIELYTVTFDINEGTGTTPAAQTVSSGSTITLPNSTGFSKSGYIFGGWNTNADGTGETYSAGFSYTVTGDVTLYVKWVCTVTFNLNYTGAPSPVIQEVNIGAKALKPSPDPIRTGYIFDNWYKDSALTAIWDFDTDVANNSITLYAKWLPVSIITFDSNGGSTVDAQIVLNGETVFEPVVPSKDGRNFMGWYTAGFIAKWNFETDIVTNDITLYARWDAYTVTFDSYGGSDVSPDIVNHGNMVTKPTDPVKNVIGYGGFIDWYIDIALTTVFAFNTPITADITLYAKWSLTSVTLGTTGPGGGKIIYQSEDGFTMRDTGEICHYLEAAPAIIGSFAWASPEYVNYNIDGIPTTGNKGTGRYSTALILAADANAPAAKACRDYSRNGKTDWFLPSSSELSELRNPAFGFLGYTYWSSTQFDSSEARQILLTSSLFSSTTNNKSVQNVVLPIRAF